MATVTKQLTRLEFDITSLSRSSPWTGDTSPVTLIHEDGSRIATQAGKIEIEFRGWILRFPAFGLGTLPQGLGTGGRPTTDDAGSNLHFDVLRGNPLNRIETVHLQWPMNDNASTVTMGLERASEHFNGHDAYKYITSTGKLGLVPSTDTVQRDFTDHHRLIDSGFREKISIAANSITGIPWITHEIEETLLQPAIIPTTDDLDTELLTLWGVLYADHYEIPEPDAGESQSITTTEPMATTNLWSLL